MMIDDYVTSLVSSPRTIQAYSLVTVFGNEWVLHTMGNQEWGTRRILFYDGQQLLMCFLDMEPPKQVIDQAITIMQQWREK